MDEPLPQEAIDPRLVSRALYRARKLARRWRRKLRIRGEAKPEDAWRLVKLLSGNVLVRTKDNVSMGIVIFPGAFKEPRPVIFLPNDQHEALLELIGLAILTDRQHFPYADESQRPRVWAVANHIATYFAHTFEYGEPP